ncbi:MAG TPA: maleylpyruvate isomerase family mycothiol-dependent enzyme [Acidimicrobiia bacterium]|nr:maleylpyruvate isomerase family mycothiol-dependent enzyme [Acidimicrobiia bacterium]
MNDFVESIGNESEAFAATIRPDVLDRRVPHCPDWTLRDLAWHLGRVQQFWALVVRAGVDERPEFEPRRPGPTEAAALAAWMRESTRELIDALRDAADDAPAWTWWGEPRTAAAVGRHQVQEAAVHRWDAQSVLGRPAPFPAALATDAVGEFVEIFRKLRPRAPIALEATDTGHTFTLSDGEAAVTVSAPSGDLLLLLYGRLSPDDVQVVGDRVLLGVLLTPIE